jgi:FkbM family methyltransferase
MSELFVDIGAGDGERAAGLARMGHIVHAFEPCTAMRDLAYRALRGLPGVTLMPYAIGGNDRQATLYRCDGEDANLYTPGEPHEGVTVVSMNHWFVYARIAEINTLYLDCNGSEVEILEQMVKCGRMRQVKYISVWWAGDERPELLEQTHRKSAGAWERIE